MAFLSMKTAVVYVSKEAIEEGVAATPSADEAIAVSDGFDMNATKELIERNTLSGSIARRLPRTGMKSATVTFPVEARASLTAGAAPEATLLFESALGGVRSQSNTTVVSGYNAATVSIGTSASNFAVGDVVMLKDTNAGLSGYHISAVSAVAMNGTNEDTLTLVAPAAVTNGSATTIEKFTTFYGTDSGHPSLTITEFLDDAYKRQATGCKVASLSMEGFDPGQVASFSFGLNGWDMTESVAVSGLTETFSDALPPLILDACVYKDGVRLEVSSFTFSVENTLPVIPSTCSATGKIGQRVTERATSGSFTVYADSASAAIFENFEDGTQFNLFASMYNPTSSYGVKKEAIGIYLPVCIITEAPMANAEGLMVYNVSFRCGPDTTGSDIYIGFC